MNVELVEHLRCPRSGGRLVLEQPEYQDEHIRSGWLVSQEGHHRYPIREFIPRFVPETNYADNFGIQWNKFQKTQLDSYSGHTISADRFWQTTGWEPRDIAGQWVLDVGCGAGRFAEVVLEAGAKVISLDYSSAVDACFTNLKHYSNLHVIQGDIYALPFPRANFPFVYSLGVLQHTPDVHEAFNALLSMVKGGGQFCVDFYEKSWKGMLLPKFWLRPITKRMSKERLFNILQWLVPKLLPFSQLLGRTPMIGRGLRRLVPVANYNGILSLDEQQHLEWSLLDTFDWFSPEYDNPQTAFTVRRWLENAGVEGIEVCRIGHLVGRGTLPYAFGS